MKTLRLLTIFGLNFPAFIVGGVLCGRAFHLGFWLFTGRLFLAILMGRLDEA